MDPEPGDRDRSAPVREVAGDPGKKAVAVESAGIEAGSARSLRVLEFLGDGDAAPDRVAVRFALLRWKPEALLAAALATAGILSPAPGIVFATLFLLWPLPTLVLALAPQDEDGGITGTVVVGDLGWAARTVGATVIGGLAAAFFGTSLLVAILQALACPVVLLSAIVGVLWTLVLPGIALRRLGIHLLKRDLAALSPAQRAESLAAPPPGDAAWMMRLRALGRSVALVLPAFALLALASGVLTGTVFLAEIFQWVYMFALALALQLYVRSLLYVGLGEAHRALAGPGARAVRPAQVAGAASKAE